MAGLAARGGELHGLGKDALGQREEVRHGNGAAVLPRKELSAPPAGVSGHGGLRASHLHQYLPLLAKGPQRWLQGEQCFLGRHRNSLRLPHVPFFFFFFPPSLSFVQTEGSKNKVTLVKEELSKLSKLQYSLEELTGSPLPDGVDPLRLEDYLSDQDFKVRGQRGGG